MYEKEELLSLSYSHPILLFDRDCILCSRFVQWIISKDRDSKIKFMGLQQVNDLKEEFDSVLLYKRGEICEKSDVTFEVMKTIGGFWSFFLPFKFVPKFIRDSIYLIISNNRYNWFGKKKNCLLMTDDIRARFL